MARLIYNHEVVTVEYPDSGGVTTFPVGRIKQDTLVLDNPSKDKSGNAYGVDIICLTKEAKWKYIELVIGREHYVTSVPYWKNHGKLIEGREPRTEVFLPLGLFGFDKVQKYEKFLEVRDLTEKDLFDVAAEPNANWDRIDEWGAAQDAKEAYLASLKYKVEL